MAKVYIVIGEAEETHWEETFDDAHGFTSTKTGIFGVFSDKDWAEENREIQQRASDKYVRYASHYNWVFRVEEWRVIE